MFFESMKLIQVFIDFTFDILNFGIQLLDLGLFELSFLSGHFSVLIPIRSCHVVALDKLDELVTIFLELGARIFESVSLPILFQI